MPKPRAKQRLGHVRMQGITRTAGPAPCLPTTETTRPPFGPGAIKSEAKTEPKLLALPGGSVWGWPLQILGIEALEFQAAVWTGHLPQIGRGTRAVRNLQSESLLAGRATGKRIGALHTKCLHWTLSRPEMLSPGRRKCNPSGGFQPMAYVRLREGSPRAAVTRPIRNAPPHTGKTIAEASPPAFYSTPCGRLARVTPRQAPW
jgi:hypothetical protein